MIHPAREESVANDYPAAVQRMIVVNGSNDRSLLLIGFAGALRRPPRSLVLISATPRCPTFAALRIDVNDPLPRWSGGFESRPAPSPLS
jgi:hypothetical protein